MGIGKRPISVQIYKRQVEIRSMILSHLPIYNFVWGILLYIQACALYYCKCSAKVPTRYGWAYRDETPKVYWVSIGMFGFCIGCFATGVVLVNCFKYLR
jgi:hypothetical protein